MTDYELHEPAYRGTTSEEWAAPDLEDFETDDLGAVDDHFLLSASGFPPERFTDLKLPVVDPSGNLNENALQAAHGGAHSVDEIEGHDDQTRQDAKATIGNLSRDAFDADVGN